MKNLYLILFLIISLNANAQQHKLSKKSHKLLISYIEKLVKETLSTEAYAYYLNARDGAMRIDYRPQKDSVGLINEPWYIGTIGFADMPMFCELYQANIQGSAKKELAGFLYLGASLGNIIFVFVLTDAQNAHKEIDVFEFSCLRNESSSLAFKQLQKAGYFDILVTADLHRSVYYNEGLHIIHTAGDSAKVVFELATVFVDHLDLDGKDVVDSCQVSFLDIDDHGNLEIKLSKKRDLVSGANTTTQKREIEIYHWDAEKYKYVN